jgi:hypothetical protein
MGGKFLCVIVTTEIICSRNCEKPEYIRAASILSKEDPPIVLAKLNMEEFPTIARE